MTKNLKFKWVRKFIFITGLMIISQVKGQMSQALMVNGYDNINEIKSRAAFYFSYFHVSEPLNLVIEFTNQLPDGVNGAINYETNGSGIKNFHIWIRKGMTRYAKLVAFAHEMVHLKQYIKGELIQKHISCFSWQGAEFIDANHVVYEQRGWEKEALSLEKYLYRLFKNRPVITVNINHQNLPECEVNMLRSQLIDFITSTYIK